MEILLHTCGGCGVTYGTGVGGGDKVCPECGHLDVLVEVTVHHDFCRASVMQLAIFMEERLRANEEKGGWEDCNTGWLHGRAIDELIELERALWADEDSEHIWREAADVANFAMMMADAGTGYFEKQGQVWKPEHRGG